MCRCIKEWTAEFEVPPNKSLRLPVGYPTPSPLTVQSPQSFRVVWWESSRSPEREGCCNACIHLTWEGPSRWGQWKSSLLPNCSCGRIEVPFHCLGLQRRKTQEIFVVYWCVPACKCTLSYCISHCQCMVFQIHRGLNALLWGNLGNSHPFITPFLWEHVFQVPKKEFRN